MPLSQRLTAAPHKIKSKAEFFRNPEAVPFQSNFKPTRTDAVFWGTCLNLLDPNKPCDAAVL